MAVLSWLDDDTLASRFEIDSLKFLLKAHSKEFSRNDSSRKRM
jgi:hypothetical protein